MGKPATTTQHNELLFLLKPLVAFLDKHKFHYFLVAGKDETCSRYLGCDQNDIILMITGMMENNPQIKVIIEHSLNELPADKIEKHPS